MTEPHSGKEPKVARFTVSPINMALCALAIFFYVKYREKVMLENNYTSSLFFYVHASLTVFFPLLVSMVTYKILDNNARQAHYYFTGAIFFCVGVVMYFTFQHEKINAQRRVEEDKQYQATKELMMKKYAVEDKFNLEQHVAEANQLVLDYHKYLYDWDFDNLNELYHHEYFVQGLKQEDSKAEITGDSVAEYKEKCRKEIISSMKQKFGTQEEYTRQHGSQRPKLKVDIEGKEFYVKAHLRDQVQVFHICFQGHLLRLRDILTLEAYEKQSE